MNLPVENPLQEYRKVGKMHRANGPAAEWDRTHKWVWWLNGKWHRYYGTCCFLGGKEDQTWWLHGKQIK